VRILGYTNWGLEGIYALQFDPATGAIIPIGQVAEAANPTFFAVHPTQRFLYAVSQLTWFQGQSSGAVNAFAIDRESGGLKHLNTVPSGGPEPCFISIDRRGRNVLVANYAGGSIAVLPIAADGRLHPASAFVQHTGSSVVHERQSQPYTHSVNASPDDRFVVAADLGADELRVYQFDGERGEVLPSECPSYRCRPGRGPRHLAFHPSGRFAYVVNELKSEVTALAWNSHRGTFNEIQTMATVPKPFSGENSPSEIAVHASGRFLYASNRGHDSIAVFAINGRDGRLRVVEHVRTAGKFPRGFRVDPTGGYLLVANQKTNKLVVFRIHPGSGRLQRTRHRLAVPSPACIQFVAPD
jgi:6-phosphogluconolactonase